MKKWYVLAGLAAAAAGGAWLIGRLRRKMTESDAVLGTTETSAFGGFKKRFFRNPDHLRQELDTLYRHPADVKTAFKSGRIDNSFAERIMLVVTGVNGCRYCRFGHTQAAGKSGIEREQIADLLHGALDSVDPAEVTALSFAMHYAETGGQPLPEKLSQLAHEYGDDGARDILVYIRMITLGNLAGNTFDAFLHRLRGQPAAGSTWQDEVATLALLLFGSLPFGIAFGVRLAWAEVAESTRPNVLVLQE